MLAFQINLAALSGLLGFPAGSRLCRQPSQNRPAILNIAHPFSGPEIDAENDGPKSSKWSQNGARIAPKHSQNACRKRCPEKLEISAFFSAAGSLRPSKFIVLLKELNSFRKINFSPRERLRAPKSHQNEVKNRSKTYQKSHQKRHRKTIAKKLQNRAKINQNGVLVGPPKV